MAACYDRLARVVDGTRMPWVIPWSAQTPAPPFLVTIHWLVWHVPLARLGYACAAREVPRRPGGAGWWSACGYSKPGPQPSE